MIGGLSSITPTHQRGTKGLMWGARGSFPPAAAMVVMVAVGSWSLGHSSTVGIVYVFYGINLFFGINIYAGINFFRPVRTGPIKFILFVNIPGLFSVYSGLNRENKFYSNMAVTQYLMKHFGLPLTYAYATLRQSVAGNSKFRGIVFCNLDISSSPWQIL